MAEKVRHPLIELTRTRVLEFAREPEAIFWVFLFPVLLALVLGLAFRSTGETAVVAAVTGPGAETLLARVEGGTDAAGAGRRVEWRALDEASAREALRDGDADVIVRVASAKGPPAVTYLFDPSRPGAGEAKLLADGTIQRAFGRNDPVGTDQEARAPAGSRYIDFVLPGLIGLNIMGSSLWGIGYAIVDARKRKLLKRFAATPMNRAHFLLAYGLSRLFFLVAEVGLLLVFGALVFSIQVRGSLILLGAIVGAGAGSFTGLALLIASRTRSTESASGWMNFVQLPMWLLSGTFFAYTRFPDFLHPFIRLLPLTALNDAFRAVMNEGASLPAVAAPLAVLAAWGALSFVAALATFRWQ